jgi:hypothetical protein
MLFFTTLFKHASQFFSRQSTIAASRTLCTLRNREREDLFNREGTVDNRPMISHFYSKHAVQQLHTMSGAPPPGVG